MQTVYNLYPSIGIVGGLADLRNRTIISQIAESDIQFGQAVVSGTIAGKVLPAGIASTEFFGVALYDATKEAGFTFGVGSTGSLHRTGSMVPTIRQGAVYVTTNRTVAYGSAAYVDVSNLTSTLRPLFTDLAEATTITFVGDFVASNTIDLNINGVAIVQVTFATNTNSTLQAVATSISNRLVAAGITAEVVVDTAARTIRIATVSDITVASIVVALGAGTPTTGAATTVANLATGGIFETASTGAGTIAKLVINKP